MWRVQLYNAFRKWMCRFRLIKITRNGEVSYMVQQRVFGFWTDRLVAPLSDLASAQRALKRHVAGYAPKTEVEILEVLPERHRSWILSSAPISPTRDVGEKNSVDSA